MRFSLLTVLLCATLSLQAQQTTRLTFDLGSRGSELDGRLIGLFYEEINRGGDGGLYAELIANRSFNYSSTSADYWSSSGTLITMLTTDDMLNDAQTRALLLTFTGTSGKLTNTGYYGMDINEGDAYTLTFWARGNGDEYEGDLVASLLGDDGSDCGSVTLSGPFSEEWTQYTATITATGSSDTGSFQLQGTQKGALVIDVVSLMPPTFNGHANGLRRDLAQMLADIQPAFIRFPGGCYVEGMSDGTNNNRFEWKTTIGPIEERPGHQNQNWGYWTDDGFGYHEMLQLCEDLDAEALFVVNIGIGHYWYEEYTDIDDYVQEALDAIEYAIGDTTTTYGSLRAKYGHPEPFNLRYIEVGNENYNYYADSNDDQSDHYAERYYTFYNALKAAYPDITLIGNVESWSTDTPSWRNGYPVEMVDEHYYRTPGWFVSMYDKYDTYSRSKGTVYVGEYASTSNYGTLGNLNAALGEAIFMQGMENNSDVVKMSSYAPLLCNENYQGWMPDLIRFNCHQACGTPAYYVQRMFGQNQGAVNIPWTEANNTPTDSEVAMRVGLGSWLTSVTYSDVQVLDAQGDVLFDGNSATANDWTVGTGTWTFADGTLSQSSTSVEGATYVLNEGWDNDTITYTLNATRNDGYEGFLVLFNYIDEDNFSWWNVGGWTNTAHGIETTVGGSKSTVTSTSGSIVTGQTYALKIVKEGTRVRCYIDDELIHDTTISSSYDRGVYVSSALTADGDQLIVKLTNPNALAQPVRLAFTNGTATAATLEILTSGSGTDENSTSAPTNVVPTTGSVDVNDDGTIDYEAPAFSLSILTIDVSDITLTETEEVSLPDADVSYTFEAGLPVDDSGTYEGSLEGGAAIATLSDGNQVLYTGSIGYNGYMDLGTDMPTAVFADDSDFTVSLAFMPRATNQLTSFCWALALCNGTSQYAGIINQSGGNNWYYEAVNGSTTVTVNSNAGIASAQWHHLAYVQQGDTGNLYIDGRLYAQQDVSVRPAQFVDNLSGAWLGRSPYSADAYMENTYYDNVRIYRSALSAEQVSLLAAETALLANDELDNLALRTSLEDLIAEVQPVEQYADDADLTAALDYANTQLTAASASIEEAIDVLQTAYDTYRDTQWSLAQAGQDANLSYLITNGLFTQGSSAWEGTDFTAISSQTAEQFSKTFDNYQVLTDMPAGIYLLVANAFYRCGAIEDAYAAWLAYGEEASNAYIYLSTPSDGEEAQRVPNLYSEEEAYTYEPTYTFPNDLTSASTALNTDSLYEQQVRLTTAATADLTLGIRKSVDVTDDWTAFDNFRLFFLSEATAIRTIADKDGAAGTDDAIYDLSGRRLLRVTHPGIYIVGGRKVVVR